MSAHNIGFYEEISKNYPLIIIKYAPLSLLLNCTEGVYDRRHIAICNMHHRFRFIYSKQFKLFEPLLALYQSLYDFFALNLKLQYDFLAFIASLFRVTEED